MCKLDDEDIFFSQLIDNSPFHYREQDYTDLPLSYINLEALVTNLSNVSQTSSAINEEYEQTAAECSYSFTMVMPMNIRVLKNKLHPPVSSFQTSVASSSSPRFIYIKTPPETPVTTVSMSSSDAPIYTSSVPTSVMEELSILQSKIHASFSNIQQTINHASTYLSNSDTSSTANELHTLQQSIGISQSSINRSCAKLRRAIKRRRLDL